MLHLIHIKSSSLLLDNPETKCRVDKTTTAPPSKLVAHLPTALLLPTMQVFTITNSSWVFSLLEKWITVFTGPAKLKQLQPIYLEKGTRCWTSDNQYHTFFHNIYFKTQKPLKITFSYSFHPVTWPWTSGSSEKYKYTTKINLLWLSTGIQAHQHDSNWWHCCLAITVWTVYLNWIYLPILFPGVQVLLINPYFQKQL